MASPPPPRPSNVQAPAFGWTESEPAAITTSMADSTDDDEMERPGAQAGGITTEALTRAIGDRYLQYALSTITNRALPDARDGLKPVQRRILYGMRALKLDPEGGFRKCAKIVGDVMGNFHPHGNQAIYDALVRLAQDFSVRYPLVDGQGNFGNVDGDNAAADRYTEARMTAAAEALLDGLAENAVDFRPNYDGTDEEPVVLPAAFPNLLANGATGIAVGMATSIPPHNVGELCDAALHLIKSPNARVETLVDHVPGPDFPTGGVMVEGREAVIEAYRAGRGAFRLRAAWGVEEAGRGQWRIVVTEIPYQVQKSKLIEKIAELINAKRIPILADVRDESAEDIRLVLEPRSRNVDPAVLMETMFRLTDLETRFSLNMNVLIDGRVPQVSGLREVLRAFLDHRREVLIRRSRHRMEKIDRRLEVLEGYIVAFLNLDRVIEIIRNEDEPKAVMIAEFELTDAQAEAILNMRLRSLRKLEEMELRRERDALQIERAELEDLLESEDAQWSKIEDQLRETREAFGAPKGFRRVTAAEEIARLKAEYGEDYPPGARRTGLADAPTVEEMPVDAMIEREPITVVCSQMGWIRALRGPSAAGRRAEVQGWRRAALRFPCRDDRQAPDLRHQRAVLYPRGRQAPGRAGDGRAGAADGRPAERRGHGRPFHPSSGREAADRVDRRRRVRGRRRRGRRPDPDRQTGAQRQGAGEGPGLSPGRGRSRRGRGRKTARCWSLRLRSCRRCRAARA